MKRKVILMNIIFLLFTACGATDNKMDWVPEGNALKNPVHNEQMAEKNDKDQVKQDEDYFEIPNKVLVIGNSITMGFGTHGMASSSVETDYYFLLNVYLSKVNPSIVMDRIPGYGWEGATNSEDRDLFFEESIKPYLEDCDLVIIQLGDNINTADKQATLKNDTNTLLQNIRSVIPEARIVWVFGRYCLNNTDAIRISCEVNSVDFVDISVISTSEEYMAWIGYEYTDESGNVKQITNGGVASHPNDYGMETIANLIIDDLGY